MPTLVFSREMPCSVDELWRFHSSASALKTLTPPGRKMEIEGDPPVRTGELHRATLRQFGIPIRWDARIESATPPRNGGAGGFVDVAERSPFAAWRHEHRFEPIDEDRSRLVDELTYTLPFGPLGRLADRLFVRREIERLFAFRHAVTLVAVGGKEGTLPED